MDEMLDSRDQGPIDAEWGSTYAEVGFDVRLPNAKEVFVAISNATAQHEITSYIANDLDLLTTADSRGFQNEFTRFLADSYSRGRFPYQMQ
jgi:hypothetical protein